MLETDLVAVHVDVSDERLTVHLADERAVSVPLSWFPRLVHASAGERANWRLLGEGEAIEWPDLDEHIGLEGLIAGRRSGEGQDSLRRWRASHASGQPIAEYRRQRGRNTWHWSPACSQFPAQASDTEILFIRPLAGEFCNQCHAMAGSANGR
ncbi:MAG TPA: DUF2442 domain-containing protein [Longimicrobium sp.]|nr:DUF2442 domain-containing protein [Longimicrobium sp.]